LAGTFKTYYEQGTLETTGEYKSNRKHGIFTTYYLNGIMKEQGEYVANKKHKQWKTFDEKGVLIKTDTFKAGVLIESKDVK
jgi:uncharacterized protein